MSTPIDRRRVARLGGLAFLGLALLSAGAAAFALSKMMSAAGYTRGQVRPVVVAARTLEGSSLLTAQDLKVVEWPVESAPDGVFGSIDEVMNKRDKKPVLLQQAFKGEPIVDARLAKPNAGIGLAARLDNGMRAFAVRVDDAVTRAGLVYPGAHVDVIATLEQSQPPTSILVLQNKKVLAVERNTDTSTQRKKTKGAIEGSDTSTDAVVTLEVLPGEMETISMAARQGTVDLVLRNEGDPSTITEPKGVTPAQHSVMLSAPPPPAHEHEKAPPQPAAKKKPRR